MVHPLSGRNVRGAIVRARHKTYAGCVGRTLYPHVDFGERGGYDTDGVWGRGYDDMVLRDSLRALHYMSNSEGFPVIVTKGKRQVFLGTAVLLSPWAKHGGALPHDSNMFNMIGVSVTSHTILQPDYLNTSPTWGTMSSRSTGFVQTPLAGRSIPQQCTRSHASGVVDHVCRMTQRQSVTIGRSI